jgi:hypothetical protein
MKRKSSDDDNILAKSYCLWGPGSNVAVAADKDNIRQKTFHEHVTSGVKESVRSQETVKESVVPEQRVKDFGKHTSKTKSGNKKDRVDNSTKDIPATGKGKRTTRSKSGDIKAEVSKRSGSTVDRHSKTDDGKNDKGFKRGKGEEQKTPKQRKDVSVFPPSNVLMNSVKLHSKPVETEDFSLVQIDIDGKTYEVSSWSIRDGDYIQGLDSNFLVHGFINKKPR